MKSIYGKLIIGFLVSILFSFSIAGYFSLRKNANELGLLAVEELKNSTELIEDFIQLIDRDDCYCVGRLDKDTTGFVLLTNDKSLSKKLLLPHNHVEKTYEVQTKLPITENYVEAFQKGMMIDRTYQCLPAELEIKDDYHCLVTICEGRYHQIKKMFLSMSNEVVSLKRIAFAHIVLDEQLKYGQYRQLNEDEMKLLQNALA